MGYLINLIIGYRCKEECKVEKSPEQPKNDKRFRKYGLWDDETYENLFSLEKWSLRENMTILREMIQYLKC